MLKADLAQELRREILRLRDERIRLEAEMKAKTELLQKLEAAREIPGTKQPVPPFEKPAGLTWSDAIIVCLKDLGGRGGLQQIYSRISRYISLKLTHQKETRWGGRPAFQHQVRSYISNLVKDGTLRKASRGVYELTSKAQDSLSRRVGDEAAELLALTAQSDPALAEVWNNSKDAAYDRL